MSTGASPKLTPSGTPQGAGGAIRPVSHAAAAWIYQGVWGILARWFRVPEEPPTLPFHDGMAMESFRPAEAFLRYLKLQFWVFATLGAVGLAAFWLFMLAVVPIVAALVLIPMVLAVVVPNSIRFVALHLRFDTTWYVLTDRSLRIRRGIWTIEETTITFENIQNVVINQGPLQRLFGIADVVVQTAGGGSRGPHGEQLEGPHAGVLEGLADAERIRDLILSRLKQSKSAGLGDEGHASAKAGAVAPAWSPRHIELLREIRDRARAMG